MNKTITQRQKNKLLKLLKNIIIYDIKQGLLLDEVIEDLPYHMELSNVLSKLNYYKLLEKQGYNLNSLELVIEFLELINIQLKILKKYKIDR